MVNLNNPDDVAEEIDGESLEVAPINSDVRYLTRDEMCDELDCKPSLFNEWRKATQPKIWRSGQDRRIRVYPETYKDQIRAWAKTQGIVLK